jgi:hypothetical protein
MSLRSPGAASAPLTILLLLATVATAPAAADPDPVPSDPVFTALRIDGTTASGRIRRLGPEEGLVMVPVDGPEQVVPLDRLVKLDREAGGPASTPEGAVVLFPEGDRLRGAIIGAADETSLKVLSPTLGDLDIPLEGLLGLVLKPPTDVDEADAFLARVRSAPRKTELLWLANGDLLAGGFLGWTRGRSSSSSSGARSSSMRSEGRSPSAATALGRLPRPEGTSSNSPWPTGRGSE